MRGSQNVDLQSIAGPKFPRTGVDCRYCNAGPPHPCSYHHLLPDGRLEEVLHNVRQLRGQVDVDVSVPEILREVDEPDGLRPRGVAVVAVARLDERLAE